MTDGFGSFLEIPTCRYVQTEPPTPMYSNVKAVTVLFNQMESNIELGADPPDVTSQAHEARRKLSQHVGSSIAFHLAPSTNPPACCAPLLVAIGAWSRASAA